MKRLRVMDVLLLYLAILMPSAAYVTQSVLLSLGRPMTTPILYVILPILGSLASAILLQIILGRLTAQDKDDPAAISGHRPVLRFTGLFAAVTLTVTAFRAMTRLLAWEASQPDERLYVLAAALIPALMVCLLARRLIGVTWKPGLFTGSYIVLLTALSAGDGFFRDLMLHLDLSAFLAFFLYKLLLALPVLLMLVLWMKPENFVSQRHPGLIKKPVFTILMPIILALAGVGGLLLFLPKQVSAQSLLYEEIDDRVAEAGSLMDQGKPYAAYIKAKDALALSGVLDAYAGLLEKVLKPKKQEGEPPIDIQAVAGAMQNAVSISGLQDAAKLYQGFSWQAAGQEDKILGEFEESFYSNVLPADLRLAAGLALLQNERDGYVSRYLAFHQELVMVGPEASLEHEKLSGREEAVRKKTLPELERSGLQQLMSLYEFRLFDLLLSEAGFLLNYFPENDTLNRYIVLSDLERTVGYNDYKTALAAMDRIIAHDPGNVENLEFCMGVYDRIGAPDGAFNLAKAYYDAHPTASKAKDLYAWSIAVKNAGQPLKDEDKLAIRLAQEALLFSDRPWMSQHTLATLYLRNNDYYNALDAIGNYFNLTLEQEEGVETMPDDLFSFAQAYVAKLTDEEAYKAVMEFVPHWHAFPDLVMGLDALNKGQFAQAEAFLEAAVQNGLPLPKVYVYLGFAYQDHWLLDGRPENYLSALNCFKEAVLREPSSPTNWFALATLFLNGGEDTNAMEAFERVKLLSGQNGQDSLHLYNHADSEIQLIEGRLKGGQ